MNFSNKKFVRASLETIDINVFLLNYNLSNKITILTNSLT